MLCKKLLQTYHCRSTSFQKLSTVTNNELPVEQTKEEVVPKKPVSPKNSKLSVEVINHLKEINSEHYLNFIPKRLLRKSARKNISLHLVNRDTSKKFCSLIANDLLKNTSYVIENNSGLGLLTEELLKIGVPAINVYEKNSSFLESASPLSHLIKKHSSKLKLRQLNFTDVWGMAIRDNYNYDVTSDSYLEDAPSLGWHDETYAQIILSISDRASLVMLIHNFFHKTSLFTRGRPVFYFALNTETWDRILSCNEDIKKRRYYNAPNVFLNLFFDCEVLGELPRHSFIPWPASKKKKEENIMTVPMLVIKIEPKKNAYYILIEENIKPFWYFLKHCMRSTKVRVIREIEILAPGCGALLIEKNIDITTTFKELQPQKILDIFQIFRSCPEYDENTFMNQPQISEDIIKPEEDEKFESETKLDQEIINDEKDQEIETKEKQSQEASFKIENEQDEKLDSLCSETKNEEIEKWKQENKISEFKPAPEFTEDENFEQVDKQNQQSIHLNNVEHKKIEEKLNEEHKKIEEKLNVEHIKIEKKLNVEHKEIEEKLNQEAVTETKNQKDEQQDKENQNEESTTKRKISRLFSWIR